MASQAGVEMGPLVTADHCKKVAGYIEKGVAEGATPLVRRPRAASRERRLLPRARRSSTTSRPR